MSQYAYTTNTIHPITFRFGWNARLEHYYFSAELAFMHEEERLLFSNLDCDECVLTHGGLTRKQLRLLLSGFGLMIGREEDGLFVSLDPTAEYHGRRVTYRDGGEVTGTRIVWRKTG